MNPRNGGTIGGRESGGTTSCVADEMARSVGADLYNAAAAPYRDNLDLHGDTFLQLVDMADDPHPSAGGLQLLQDRDSHR